MDNSVVCMPFPRIDLSDIFGDCLHFKIFVMERKFSFLCENYDNINFIYAVKLELRPWHYFKELDSVSQEHGSLTALMVSAISRLKKVESIDFMLSESQSRNYYENDKFVFKNEELKTCKF